MISIFSMSHRYILITAIGLLAMLPQASRADSTFTVTYTAVALQQIDSQSGLELDENQTLTIIAVSFPVAEGEAGPGEATIGSWLATNFQEWALTTPSESNNAMGATVQGDAGDTGDFELFMSDSALTLMAEYDGEEEYDAADMAVYKDETQGLRPLAQGVSQSLTVAPIPPISLNVSDSAVDKYDYVKLTGTIKSGKSGKTVTLWRRFEDTKLEKFATVTTTKNGKFKLRLKIRRTVLFKAKYKGDVSDSVSVQMN